MVKRHLDIFVAFVKTLKLLKRKSGSLEKRNKNTPAVAFELLWGGVTPPTYEQSTGTHQSVHLHERLFCPTGSFV